MSTQLGAQDAQFLFLQSRDMLMHVMNVDVFDPATARRGRVSYTDIVRHFARRCRGAPVYHRKLFRVPGNLDLPYWIDDPDFRVEEHIRRARLPRPGNWQQLSRLAAQRFAEPMDLGRPLWDLLVVEGVDAVPGAGPGSFALLQRFHHAAIDGASGAYALGVIWDADVRGTPLIGLPREHGAAPPPGSGAILARALAAHALAPAKMARVLLRESSSLLEAARSRVANRGDGVDAGIPVTRFNGHLSMKRAFTATPLPLARMQAMRRAVEGSTVNDVILAICSGALRTYLLHHDDLPPQSLVAVAPVNARVRGGAQASAGNDISAMTVPLATTLADPLERLRAIRRYTADAKAAKTGLAARLVAELGREIPGLPLAGLSRLLRSERIARSQANLVITNVPTSRQPLYLRGARLAAQFGMGPVTHGLGLFISANGYHDTIAICLTADAAQVPDVAFLRRCVEQSFEELSRAASKAAARRA